METSPFLDKYRRQGRVQGRVEGVRLTIIRQGRQKFAKAPTRKQQNALEAINDLAHLETLAERLLDVDSWAELLSEV